MLGRIIMLAVVLGIEVMVGSLAFDGAQLREQAGGLQMVLKYWGAWVLRWGVAAALFFAGFAFLQGYKMPVDGLGRVIRGGWLAGHVAALGALAVVSRSIYAGGGATDATVMLMGVLGLAVVATAAFALLPPAAWMALRRETGSLWLTAAGVGVLACGLGAASRHLWKPVTSLTFAMVHFLLGLTPKKLVMAPERFQIGTSKFTVIISPECSGLEGMGLMLIFGLVWLYLFRKELRFPQAIALLPVGIVLLYLLNVVRIFALVLIGSAGWREVAARGFHSQAGWIAFCIVALGLLMATRRLQWVSANGVLSSGVLGGGVPDKTFAEPSTAEYAAAPYLVPFMVVMAAGILSQAMTAQFEWSYGLRVVGAVIALWYFRRNYGGVDWRFGWMGAAAGVVVFLVWIGLDWLLHGQPAGGRMPAELESVSSEVRLAWLVMRITGAVVAVPVVEELAFRGFAQRRLMQEEFEAVPWRSWNWVALGGASVLFGILHGAHWLAGVAAGLVYGGVMLRRGRLGDSVVAHATTNALLAGYVLLVERWDLW